ncbi:glutamine amidotransferase-related protein [Pelagibacterium xiamenense]|uniref:glutamine amidotransferase-related protein n=1 Tax=Pelagibacterium xiamenense TaxID=2901140 RepID=UPI001E5A6E42|nr:type 1 glutamine amidotransferase [Pelagibacterium xiamenense]MCD7058902.1 type 1 glutamine amidotransferase [Pelagibacterium xiamenense]
MKLTIIRTGGVPAPLADQYPSYPAMFQGMFERDGAKLAYETVELDAGAPLPDPESLDAILITGSAYGVYDDVAWMEPLRAFIRGAHAARTKMVGICFGHQVIADALGGDVRKSEKGWGLGRHTYQIACRPPFLDAPRASLSVACSHQDQVITPPEGARVVLSSEFTPNAGLHYANGTTLSFQPHPEFSDEYALQLVRLRKGLAEDAVIEKAKASFAKPSDSPLLTRAISRFLAA